MDLKEVRRVAASHYIMNDNPALVIDLETVKRRYRNFREALPKVEVHFALKCLTDREVAKTLAKDGCSFEVASLNELQLLGKILNQTQMAKVFYSNPAKTKRSIMIALIAGVRWFSIDSLEEVLKISEVADSLQISADSLKLYLRIKATSLNSVWPLSGKFGASLDKATQILYGLEEHGIKLHGFTFHVGSQCLDHTAWGEALRNVDYLISLVDLQGLDVLSEKIMVNLGGGFPSDITSHSCTINKIAAHLTSSLEQCDNQDRIWFAAEPGRFIVSESAVLAARVILRTNKDDGDWLYLDAGVFHGMIEPSQGVMGRVSTTYDSLEYTEFRLAGPTCDSADMIPGTYSLPSEIREDDLVLIENSGAYSMAYATGNASTLQPGFNGFLPPSVYYLHK